MPLDPTHLPYHPQKKLREKGGEKEERENLVMEAAVWHSESCSKPLYPYIFLHAGVHRKVSLLWFEAPNLCYTINASCLSLQGVN